MTRPLRIIAMAACTLLACLPTFAQRHVQDSCKVNGRMRHFIITVPSAGLKAKAPLVMCVHGYGRSDNPANPADYDLDPVAEREGFAVFYPVGLRDTTGNNRFNVGYPMQRGWKVDDLSDLCKMARYIQKKYNLSADNTFATGMSNGGEMCYLLAYSNQTVFKAVAPIAGLTMRWIYETMKPVRPIPLMEVHGTEDRISEWTGDLTNKYGWGAYMPVPIAVNFWVAHNRCLEEKTDTIAGKDPTNGHYTICHRYVGGKNGTQVWLYEVVGAPHRWHSPDLNVGEEIWKFFSMYLKK